VRSADFVDAKNASAGPVADIRRSGRDGTRVDSKPAGSDGENISPISPRLSLTLSTIGTRAETDDTAPVRNGSGGDCTVGGAGAGAAAIFSGGTRLGSASIEISSMAKVLDRSVCLRPSVRAKVLALEVRLGSGKYDIWYSWLAAGNVPANR
jgi:hypothetical protein